MKKIINTFYCIVIILLPLSCHNSKLVEMNYEEYQNRIKEGDLPGLDEIKIKDEFGNYIDFDSLKTLHQEGDYFDTFYKDRKGNVVEYQLKKKSDFKNIPISCNRINKILDSIYTIDQSIRTKYDPKQDYANLEIVVNIIDQCGIPKNSKSLNAVFMVIQHNHTIHQKKYISALRESANLGLLPKSTLAMMEDRILVSEGKPQMYGTQVKRSGKESNWELHKLMKPEQVDQRRSQMNLGPLSEYLKNFGIEFDIEQVKN